MAKAKEQLTGIAAILSEREKSKTEIAANYQSERDAMHNSIEARISAMQTNPREFAAFLNMQAVTDYSVNNTLLVLAQMPGASDLRSESKWKDARRRPSGNGIRIFVPKQYTHYEERTITNAYGDQATARVGELRQGFDVGTVFDVTQTVGGPAPEKFSLRDEGDIDRASQVLLTTMPKGVDVVVNNDLACMAQYDPRSKKIEIRSDMTAENTFFALAAEITHAKIHAELNTPQYDREAYGLDANGAAYVTCRRLGIPSQPPDLSGYAAVEGMSKEAFRGILENVKAFSKEYGRRIERTLDPDRPRSPGRANRDSKIPQRY